MPHRQDCGTSQRGRLQQGYVAYKYVLSADSMDTTDGLPLTALDHPASPRLARPPKDFARSVVYLQPCDPDPDSGQHQVGPLRLRERTARWLVTNRKRIGGTGPCYRSRA